MKIQDVTTKVTRRGFANRNYPAPKWAVDQANVLIERVRDFDPGRCTAIRAELRPAVYCGPGSAGDFGAYIVEMYVTWRDGATEHMLRDIYPPKDQS